MSTRNNAAGHGDIGRLPAGMTAAKLRTVADWLDTYDRMAANYIEVVGILVEKGLLSPTLDASPQEAARVALGKEVQNDLRRWADDIDAQDGACPECGVPPMALHLTSCVFHPEWDGSQNGSFGDAS